MHIVHQLLVLLHLIGFASLFGGLLVQLRWTRPEVNAAMLHGAWLQLVTGVGLVGLLEAGLDPTVEEGLNSTKVAVKLVVTLMLVVLVVKNRKFDSIPKGLWALLGGMTVLNAAVGVLWQ